MSAFEKRFIPDYLIDSARYLENRYENKTDACEIKTGFQNIDNLFTGFKKGELVLIQSNSFFYNAVLGMNLASNIAQIFNKRILYVSFSESGESFTRKILYSNAKISIKEFYKKPFSEEYFNKTWNIFCNAVNELKKSNIYFIRYLFEDKFEQLLHKIDKTVLEVGIDVVILEASNMISSENKNKTYSLNKICQNLKYKAESYNIPVILFYDSGIDDKKSLDIIKTYSESTFVLEKKNSFKGANYEEFNIVFNNNQFDTLETAELHYYPEYFRFEANKHSQNFEKFW